MQKQHEGCCSVNRVKAPPDPREFVEGTRYMCRLKGPPQEFIQRQDQFLECRQSVVTVFI